MNDTCCCSFTGQTLCRLLQKAGQSEAALEMCLGITNATENASWAWTQAGRLHLKRKEYVKVRQHLAELLHHHPLERDQIWDSPWPSHVVVMNSRLLNYTHITACP